MYLRDQLSIIHSELQSKLKIIGFKLDNFESDFHKWPVAKNERIYRTALIIFINYLRKFLEILLQTFPLKMERLIG